MGQRLRAPALSRPQQVWELEQELLKREHALAESDAKVSQLQAQVSQSQRQQQSWQQLQAVTRHQVEAAQQAEQQARVALESAQSRVRVPPPLPRAWGNRAPACLEFNRGRGQRGGGRGEGGPP